MSKTAMIAVIVLSTIECLINGEKVTFLPSDEPQKIPKADSDEVVNRGLAKLPEKTNKTRSNSSPKLTSGERETGGADSSDGEDPTDDDKDKVNV